MAGDAYPLGMKLAGMLLGVGCATLTLTLAGCADDSDEPSADNTTPASPQLVDPEVFESRIEAPGVVTINVHTPNEGSIAGTELTVAFDEIAESGELPDDRSTPLAVYCRSGNMSVAAVDDLEALGFTDIVELDGGFNAWEASGRPLEP